MAWGPSQPPWAGRPSGGGGAPSLARAGGGEGEEERDSEFPLVSGFLSNWKIKGMCLWNFLLAIQRVLVGFKESHSRIHGES